MKRDTFIQVRVSEEEKKALTEASEMLDKPVSQIVREGVREKLAEIVPAEKDLAIAQ